MMEKFELNINDQTILLKLARHKLLQYFGLPVIDPVNHEGLPPSVRTPCGAFVSLHTTGHRLRGCIGSFKSQKPLFELVKELALSSAFFDNRFEPLEKEEMNELTIEISVLTPMKKIKGIDEIVLGKHGIYISDGFRSGTFLPQVATSTGWNKEEFLGHCSRDKAGLGWSGWKNADLFTYEAIVFSENTENPD